LAFFSKNIFGIFQQKYFWHFSAKIFLAFFSKNVFGIFPVNRRYEYIKMPKVLYVESKSPTKSLHWPNP
jgi:hypothetical protein